MSRPLTYAIVRTSIPLAVAPETNSFYPADPNVNVNYCPAGHSLCLLGDHVYFGKYACVDIDPRYYTIEYDNCDQRIIQQILG